MHGLTPVWGITAPPANACIPRCYMACVPIAVRFATALGATGAPGGRDPAPGLSLTTGTQGNPFQLLLTGAQQGRGTRGQAGHIPCPSPPPCALIKGTAWSGRDTASHNGK